jgi:hypothetical protein
MRLRIALLPETLAVCRLAPDAPSPEWPRGTFTSITRTADELSVVCDDDAVPADVRADRGWRVLRVEGPLPFELTGVAASLTAPLAEAKISVFLIATFDTDYLLVKEDVLAQAIGALRAAGHDVA